MPVKKDPNSDKWCFGKNCTFKSKKAAMKAEKAYYAKGNVEKGLDEKIEKATVNDHRKYLHDAVKLQFPGEYHYVMDHDDDYVYFNSESSVDGNWVRQDYRMGYSIDGVDVTLNDDREPVARETVYTPKKDETIKKSLKETIKETLHELFGEKEFKPESDEGFELPIIKQFEEEEMVAIEPMYCPPGVADGHGEGMDEDTIRKMVDSANEKIESGELSGGLFHAKNTGDIQILKTWVNECDCTIGDTPVVEGQPIAKVKFHNKDLWEMRKSGELGGLTIGAKGKRVDNE